MVNGTDTETTTLDRETDESMHELIRITPAIIGDEEVNSVDARELHEFLRVRTAFSDWFKKKTEEYGFVNNSDHLKLSNRNYSGIGKAPIDYWITVDMAKELSMLQKNYRGKQARMYFIERDKKAKELEKKSALPDFTDPVAAARAWADEREQKQIAEQMAKEAIRTKAEIGSRREATAMATASIAKRENERLKEQIGDSKKYKQAKAIPWLSTYFDVRQKGTYTQVGRLIIGDLMPCAADVDAHVIPT